MNLEEVTGMNERLMDYVRQAMALDAVRAATLADSSARQALLERIVDSPIPAVRGLADGVTSPKRARRRWVLVVGAGVATVAAAVVASAFVPDGQPRRDTELPLGQGRGDVFAGVPMAQSCVESYAPRSLARRSFAFDGTVVGLGTAAEADLYLPVTFRVHEWFKGGQGESVTVKLLRPGGGISVEMAAYGVGSRLLVTGEPRFGGGPLNDPVAWACGFTRWYDEAEATAWRNIFR
jgi:hypothetical protein